MPVEIGPGIAQLFESYYVIKNYPRTADCKALNHLTGVPVNDVLSWFKRRRLLQKGGAKNLVQPYASRVDRRANQDEKDKSSIKAEYKTDVKFSKEHTTTVDMKDHSTINVDHLLQQHNESFHVMADIFYKVQAAQLLPKSDQN